MLTSQLHAVCFVLVVDFFNESTAGFFCLPRQLSNKRLEDSFKCPKSELSSILPREAIVQALRLTFSSLSGLDQPTCLVFELSGV